MTEIFEKRLADAFGLMQSDLPAALAEYRAIRDDAQRAGDCRGTPDRCWCCSWSARERSTWQEPRPTRFCFESFAG